MKGTKKKPDALYSYLLDEEKPHYRWAGPLSNI